MYKDDKNKSINEIKKIADNQPEYGSSLEKNILQAEKKPLKDLSNEDLRMFLGQNLHLELVLPIVMDRLKQDILIRSEDMDIILLSKLLQIKSSFWSENTDSKNDLIALVKEKLKYIEDPKNISESDLGIYKEKELPELKKLIDFFMNGA